jgi:hypothetical protein
MSSSNVCTTYVGETAGQDDSSKPKSQARPTEERFLLRVDGQIKHSFSSREPVAIAGAAIKKAFPVVVVSVVDTQEHTTEIINPS